MAKATMNSSLMEGAGEPVGATKRSTVLEVEEPNEPDGQSTMPLVEEYLERVRQGAATLTQNYENYFDYAVKYESGDGDGKEAKTPTIDLGPVPMAWCLVFELEADLQSSAASPGGEEEGVDSMRVPQECVDLVKRMWTADLTVEAFLSADGTEIIVSCGLSYEILVDEATAMNLGMRLRACKGSAKFEKEKMHHYALDQFADDPRLTTVFTSAHRQRLTYNRMVRVAGIDLAERQFYMDREDSLEQIQEHLSTDHHIRAKLIREVLSACGGFRANAETILGPQVRTMAVAVVEEPFFTVEPVHTYSEGERAAIEAQNESMRQHGLEPVTYESVRQVIDTLTDYVSKEPGMSEKYIGSLRMYFALHSDHELEYLQHTWGTFTLLCPHWVYGKIEEGNGSPCYFEQDPAGVRHSSLTWIPLDTIRDYFGDHVGLYSAWLNLYTRSMVFPAILGLFTQVFTLMGSIDDNPMVVPYSVFLCVWSATFIGLWKRRETELKFLWGSEGAEETETVRPQFVGQMVMNKETKTVELRPESQMKAFGKLLASSGVTLVIIFAVIIGAFSASMIRYHEVPLLCHEHPELLRTPELLCARCEAPFELLANSGLDGNSSEANYTTVVQVNGKARKLYRAPTRETGEFFTIVPFDNAQISKAGCLAKCDEGNPDAGIPPTPGCFSNPDQTNIWYEGYPAGSTAWQKNKWKWTSAALNTVLIVVFGHFYESTAISMNKWENHRTQTQFDDHLIQKNFVFQFVNNYFVLFYIAYMRQIELPLVDVDAECKGGSCLSELSVQMGVVFTTKTVVAQIVEIAKPYLKPYIKQIATNMYLRRVEKKFNKLGNKIGQFVLPEELEQTVGVDDPALRRKAAMEEKAQKLQKRLEAMQQSKETSAAVGALRESYLVEYPSTFDDFNEMAIQFGYLALFSPAYPMAPLLGLINNLLEIRVDASKLCNTMQRPAWKTCEDIGSWSTVLNVLGFFAIMVNSTMIAFVGQTYAETETEVLGGFAARIENWHLWGRAVMIEHGMLLLRILIILLFPEVPSWLDDSRAALQMRLDSMKDLKATREEEELHKAFQQKLNAGNMAAVGAETGAMDHLTTDNLRSHMKKSKAAKLEKKAAKKKSKPDAFVSPKRGDTPGASGIKVHNPLTMGGDLDDDDDDDESLD